MTIALSPEMERFVEEKIRSGQYPSADQVIDGALAALRDAESLTPRAVEELRRDIRVGIDQLDRGLGKPWDAEEMKSRVRAYVARGEAAQKAEG